jgi:hypothetical protein
MNKTYTRTQPIHAEYVYILAAIVSPLSVLQQTAKL